MTAFRHNRPPCGLVLWLMRTYGPAVGRGSEMARLYHLDANPLDTDSEMHITGNAPTLWKII
jgi:hypothetical protein